MSYADRRIAKRRWLSSAHRHGDIKTVKRLTKEIMQAELALRGGIAQPKTEREPFDDSIDHIGR